MKFNDFTFKIWDVKEKIFVSDANLLIGSNKILYRFYDSDINENEYAQVLDFEDPERYEVYRDTTYNDKEGNVIYEGDILEFDSGLIAPVLFDKNSIENSWSFYIVNTNEYIPLNSFRCKGAKVIGNILINEDILDKYYEKTDAWVKFKEIKEKLFEYIKR